MCSFIALTSLVCSLKLYKIILIACVEEPGALKDQQNESVNMSFIGLVIIERLKYGV